MMVYGKALLEHMREIRNGYLLGDMEYTLDCSYTIKWICNTGVFCFYMVNFHGCFCSPLIAEVVWNVSLLL